MTNFTISKQRLKEIIAEELAVENIDPAEEQVTIPKYILMNIISRFHQMQPATWRDKHDPRHSYPAEDYNDLQWEIQRLEQFLEGQG